MKVRICGPNLHHQSRGTFHVHADGCGDLRHYGPGRREGGNWEGVDETLVDAHSVRDLVLSVYDNGILDEAVAEWNYNTPDSPMTLEEMADSPAYADDFWLAPCCRMISKGTAS